VYVCPNLGSDLTEVPEGYIVEENGDCVEEETPPTETDVTIVSIPDSCGIEDIDALIKAAGYVEDSNPSSVGIYEKGNVFLSVDDQRDANGDGDVILTYSPKSGSVFADSDNVEPDGSIIKSTTLTNAACPITTDLPDALPALGSNSAEPLAWGVGLIGAGSAMFLLYLFGPYLMRLVQARRATSA
jgi:hypothetical protein